VSVLPRSVPAPFTEQLHAALTAAGVAFDPTLTPRSRIVHPITHQGRDWAVRYIANADGMPVWQLFGDGPDFEWGPTAEVHEIVAAVTAPEPEPEPADPYAGAPRTHLGVDIPDMVRAVWGSREADMWTLGVLSAVGKLPANRPR
jgi:hypothetical protein